ncbi:hypothetical protein B0H14DRAFT_3492934 [Mycena olivaceomarginata]|nr:hypothetical protein B0H14DRAFT_3492934 [Mycena olivaceomarginata]
MSGGLVEERRDPDVPPPKAEDVKLWLPSDMGEEMRRLVCKRGVAEVEAKLRRAQCVDALDVLRSRLHAQTHLILYRNSNAVGQAAATRSATLIGRNVFELQFKELRAADLNTNVQEESDAVARKKLARLGSSKRTRMEPMVKKTFSWIWTVGGGPAEEDAQLHEAVRVEWSKARARRDRWVEEGKWQERTAEREDVDLELRAGLRAYALRQAYTHRRIAEGFHAGWNCSMAAAVRRVVERDGGVHRDLLRERNAWLDIPDSFDDDTTFGAYKDDILHGRVAAEISHAGESVQEDAAADSQTLLEKLCAHHNLLFAKRHDTRNCNNRAEEGLGKLYKHPEDAVVEERTPIYVVDLFSAYYADVPSWYSERFVVSAYVGQGLMPAAPYSPNVAITVRTLEIFRVTQLCCPRLGVQLFVRALCDIHEVPTRPYLGAQFSVAFDVYLAIRAEVDKRTEVALGRDTPNWRLKNNCPCCLYKLEGEEVLRIPLLCTFDGNNSLARFWRREREWVDDSGTAVPGASKECHDDRVAPGDCYLLRQEVDRWAKEGLEELMKGFEAGTGADDPDDDGCDEQWANMKEDVTARAYRMYDETGFFPCLCRHSFVLVAVDMVKSGELAKYGFAITAHLLNVLGEVATGYNIRCKFGKMSLVGAFHGHAHCRRCQLKNLTTYVEGVGLEGLEECESFFSKSNALASRTRYSTAFHRQQANTMYLKHADTVDAYQGLSTVLANKYRRALKIKALKEKTYLNSLTKEPVQETLWMEYYQKLVNLHDHESHLSEIRTDGLSFVEAVPGASYSAAAGQTQRIETQRRHATELVSKTLAVVQDLELRLGIAKRWEPDGTESATTALMVANRRYQRPLNELEGLVVARMFELSKVHMADTGAFFFAPLTDDRLTIGSGYKLRKHIAKALQARSKGVRSALDRYNATAVMLSPPRTQLSWERDQFLLLQRPRNGAAVDHEYVPSDGPAMILRGTIGINIALQATSVSPVNQLQLPWLSLNWETVETANAMSGRLPIAAYIKDPTAPRYGTFFIFAMSATLVGHWDFVRGMLGSRGIALGFKSLKLNRVIIASM